MCGYNHLRMHFSLPGSVAEIREPKRREGMIVFEKSSGIGVPVTEAALEPTVLKISLSIAIHQTSVDRERGGRRGGRGEREREGRGGKRYRE